MKIPRQKLALSELKKKNLTTKSQRKIKTIVSLDFETYFAKDYSLRQQDMTTTKYVRDPRFLVHCVAIQTNRMAWPHEYMGAERVERALRAIDWSQAALVAHHAHFEAFVLSQHYGIHPAYIFDTLSMARPVLGYASRHDLDTVAAHFGYQGKIKDVLEQTKGLRELPPELMRELSEYCAQDTALLPALFMEMVDYFPPEELDVIDLTVKMFSEPVIRLDRARARRSLQDEVAKRESLIQACGVTEKVLGSADQFAAALQAAGATPPTKISPTTGKVTHAFAQTDRDFQELAKHPKKQVRLLQEARLAVKSNIGITRARRLIEHSYPNLPIYLNAYGAHTLRWTGGDKINPQNLTRGGELRKSLMAPVGHKLIAADASQIEARLNAYLAGETYLLEQFASGEDPYSDFASRIYGRTITKDKDPLERFIGKTCILGLGYGMGANKLQHTLAVGQNGPAVFLDLEDCVKIVRLYRQTFNHIEAQWKYFDRMLAVMISSQQVDYQDILRFERERVVLPNGMDLKYPDLRGSYDSFSGKLLNASYLTHKGRTKIYGALLTENIIQCLARLVTAHHTWEVGQRWKIVMSTHDEMVACVPNAEVTEAKAFITERMITPPAWCPDIPLGTELAVGTRYEK